MSFSASARVEKQTKQHQASGLSESNKLFEVYRGIPVFREKVKNDPPEYRFRAPRARSRTIDRLREKLDKQLDTPTNSKVDNQDSEGSYRQKWENCQVELEDTKRREARMLSDIEKIQGKVDGLSTEILRLKEEAVDLRTQIKAAKATISELENKK